MSRIRRRTPPLPSVEPKRRPSEPKRIRLFERSEAYEVQFPDGPPPKYFHFEDEPLRRSILNLVTKEEALRQAKAFARAEQDALEGDLP